MPTGQIKPGSIEAFGMYLQSGILVRFGFAHADRAPAAHLRGPPPSSGDGGGPTQGEPLPGRDGGEAEEAEEGAGGLGRAAAQDGKH